METSEDMQAQVRADVETELMAALDRLKQQIRNGHAVRLSYSAVAKEAGRSRTLIGHENCAYTEVREAIGEAIRAQKMTAKSLSATGLKGNNNDYRYSKTLPREAETVSPLELVESMKRQIAYLKQQVEMAAVKIVTIDDENQQLRDEIARLNAERRQRRADPPFA